MNPPGPAPAPLAVTPDLVSVPASLTPARLGLGRAGAGLPTRAALAFAVAHAEARDAVHAALDVGALGARLAPLQLEVVTLESAAPTAQPFCGARTSVGACRAMPAACSRPGCASPPTLPW